MPAKKSNGKKPAKNKEVTKKVTKKPAVKKATKPVKKPVKKVIKKEVKKTVKKVEKKLTKKAVKKIEKKPVKKVAQPVKKIVAKKEIKKAAKTAKPAKQLKSKEVKTTRTKAEDKTSAKIIAKAKAGSSAVKEKEVEKTVPEKKDSQKNLIIVKKLPESRNKVTFKIGDCGVYPSHGVGKITEIEKTTVLGQDFSCYLMYFEKEKLTIKIPVNSAEKIGLRHLVSKSQMDEVFSILRSGVKKLKGMWSRRAQEYETKINSGEIMLLAEVLRDLTRDIEDGDRSYSERIIYETAVYRLAAEYAVVYGIEFEEAKEKIISTAKDKLGLEGKINQKDEFDEFDYDSGNSEEEDEDDEENDEEEEEDDFDYGGGGGDDEDYDDDDDDAPKKRKKKK